MSSQKNDMITRQVQKQHMEGEVSPQTSGSPMTTSRMRSQNVSIATSTDTWQKNADQKRKKTSDNALNATKKGILPKIVEGHIQ